jgi:hypothetical protein
LPAGAIALAYGLVKGADALEADAKEERLRYISDLLKEQSAASLGKLGATAAPFIFAKVFGSKRAHFIKRSQKRDYSSQGALQALRRPKRLKSQRFKYC